MAYSMKISPQPCALPPIAVVGMSAELPSGTHSPTNLDLMSFKDILLRGQDVYEKFPHERINIRSWKGTGLGQIMTDSGAFLKDLTLFDHLEFGVSSKEARAMAVGTRKLLEQSFLALLDSGIDYRRRNIGCYMSAVGSEINSTLEPDELEARGSFAGAPCMVANRISYYLDLLGPSVPVDTACSSSLTAMHLAVQAIRNGECDAAVVGGCQVNHRPIEWFNYSQGKILSADGKCKPFDASADGFGRGEGTVVIVLKLLSDAIRDGDYIYCSILGTGINASGCVAPVSAPVAEAQKEAMYRAYASTGRSPVEVDFVELHATGTAAGDPTEANWVGETFKRDGELLIGSVKGNLGHLEITSFLASLVKVCTIFRTGIIPPNVNFKEPNPAIKWAEYGLRVVTTPMKITPRSKSGRALISITSSGIGGSNGHAVIEAPPPNQKTPTSLRLQATHVPVLLVAAGLTPRSATSISEALVGLVSKTPAADMPLLSTILGRRARQLTWRSFAVVLPEQSLSIEDFSSPAFIPRNKPPLAFLFSGQGPQHIEMGRQLFAAYPIFRQTILCLDNVYEQVVGQSLMSSTGLFSSSPAAEMQAIWPISIVLPAIAMVQIALVDLLSSIGVTPNIVLGHSAGETAMLYACGAASKEMAFSIAVARATAMQVMEGVGGTMASLACNPREAQSIIDDICDENPSGKIEIACFNAPEAITIAGLDVFVAKAVELAKARGFFATKLRTRVPVHSSIMDICEERYRSLVGNVFEAHAENCIPRVRTYSTLTGKRWESPFTAEYFWENARQPIRFSETVSTILADAPNVMFLEIGPHPVLSSYIVESGARPDSVVFLMRRSKVSDIFHESHMYLNCLGQLVSKGHATVNFASLNEINAIDPGCISLPSYPLIRRHVPYLPDASVFGSRLLNGRKGPLNDVAMRINSMTHPVLAQHVIKGEPIMPAAGYLEMLFESGAKHLWNVEFRSMLSLSSVSPVPVVIDLDGLKWTVKTSVGHKEKVEYRIHAEGYFSYRFGTDHLNLRSLNICSLMDRCLKVDIKEFYNSLKYFAEYGPDFRQITACYKGRNEVLAQVRGRTSDIENTEQYIIHPALLDSCFHVSVHRMLTGNVDDNVYYLPSHVDDVYLYKLLINNGPPKILYVHAVFRQWHPDYLVFDFDIAGIDGSLLCSLVGFKVARHRVMPRNKIQCRFDIVREPVEQNAILVPGSHSVDDERAPNTQHFELGHEMQLQERLQSMDRNKPNTLWITSGLDSDGAGAQGFTRCLRREAPLWNVHLVSLPREWTMIERQAAVQRLWKSGISESEIIVDKDWNIFRPRVSMSPAPEAQKFNPHSLWYLDGEKGIVQATSEIVPEGHRMVAIEATSLPDAGLRGFVGHVLQSNHLKSMVIGITDNHFLSNYTVVHEG